MTCPKCSQQAAEGCIICPYCLTPLDSGEDAAKAPKTAESKPVSSFDSKAAKKKKGRIAAAAVFAALIIAAAVLFFFCGCSAGAPSDAAVEADSNSLAGMQWFEDGTFAMLDSDPTLYAGSPIVGTWVLLADYNDGYHDRDNIAEYTSDGYVYEWYGDGLGYYDPLCSYDYDDDTLVYHYFTDLGSPEDYTAVFSCTIEDTLMTTTDAQGICSQFIRISDEINLSVDEVTALYPHN